MTITLRAINIYPVKGLKGIAVDSARCTDRGLEHDRRWMVVDFEGVFLTQRDHLTARLGARGHAGLPMNRFRPNLVVAGSDAYAEDDWNEIRVGGAAFRAAKPCGRCQVTTTDQGTGEVKGPEPLATLASYRDSRAYGQMFGMNLVTVRTGTVRVGDNVDLK